MTPVVCSCVCCRRPVGALAADTENTEGKFPGPREESVQRVHDAGQPPAQPPPGHVRGASSGTLPLHLASGQEDCRLRECSLCLLLVLVS